MKRTASSCLVAAGSGAIAALAFPTPGLWPLVLVAWAPVFVLARGGTLRDAARYGAFAALAFYLVLLRWMAPLSVVGFVATSAWLALFVTLSFAVVPWLARAVHGPIAIAAAWVALDWTRGWAFGGFGWGSLGYALAARPELARAAAFGGLTLVTFAIVLVNVALAEAWMFRDARARAAALAGLALAIVALGWTRSPTTAGALRVAVVDASIAPAAKWGENGVYLSFNGHALLTDRASTSKPALIVWPETALPVPLDSVGAMPVRAMSLVRRVRESWRAPLLLGVPEATGDGKTFKNSAVLVRADAPPEIVYRKRRLVPFGESSVGTLPRLLPGPELVPGDGGAAIVVDGARVSVLICFEDLFAEDALLRARDGELIALLTNDAWLGESGALQHHQVAVLRAIESGRTIVRAANRGQTTIIDALGRSLPSGPVVVGAAARSNDVTIYARAPDALPIAAWLVAAMTLATVLSRREVTARARRGRGCPGAARSTRSRSVRAAARPRLARGDSAPGDRPRDRCRPSSHPPATPFRRRRSA